MNEHQQCAPGFADSCLHFCMAVLISATFHACAGVSDAFLGQLAAACTNLQEIRLTLAAVTDQEKLSLRWRMEGSGAW
eukprot:1158469-Pelagomonas_calceolata.AAC.9